MIGGYVSRNAAYPRIAGLYFFADLCGGAISTARNVGGTFLTETALDTGGTRSFSSFGEGEDGALFVTDIAAGVVLRAVSPLFVDTFDVPVPGPDPDWQAVRGSWTATPGGAFAPDPAAVNLAFAAGTLTAPVPSGRITAKVQLPTSRTANADLIFHARDAKHYRFVRQRPGKILIGQVGDFGHARAGIKRIVRALCVLQVPASGARQGGTRGEALRDPVRRRLRLGRLRAVALSKRITLKTGAWSGRLTNEFVAKLAKHKRMW